MIKNTTEPQSIRHREKELLTINEAAALYGVKLDYFYKLNVRRAIPRYKPGGKILFYHIDDLNAYFSSGRVASNAELQQEAQTRIQESAKRRAGK